MWRMSLKVRVFCFKASSTSCISKSFNALSLSWQDQLFESLIISKNAFELFPLYLSFLYLGNHIGLLAYLSTDTKPSCGEPYIPTIMFP